MSTFDERYNEDREAGGATPITHVITCSISMGHGVPAKDSTDVLHTGRCHLDRDCWCGERGAFIRCDCGEEMHLDSPEEVAHYVWAMRPDGTRSNLGNCPVEVGLDAAVAKTRRVFGWNPVLIGRTGVIR